MALFKPFDAARYLQDDETILAYLQEVAAQSDPEALKQALAAVARAKGLDVLAQRAGMSSASLDNALSAPDPLPLGTLVKLLEALGLSLSIAPLGSAHAAE